MKILKVFRKLDSRGRITIPKDIRNVLKVEQGSELEFFIENEIICIKKFEESSNSKKNQFKLI